jgi:hypothetical protein
MLRRAHGQIAAMVLMRQPRSRRTMRQVDRLARPGREEDEEALEPGVRWVYDYYDRENEEEEEEEKEAVEDEEEEDPPPVLFPNNRLVAVAGGSYFQAYDPGRVC